STGNHWARVCVNYINALTSRKMPTVFVREGAKTADNRQVYVLLVPGLRMEFSQHPNSAFVIHELFLDDSYFELQKTHKKPGLFKVRKSSGGIYEGELIKKISPIPGRAVAISECTGDLSRAMDESGRAVKEPLGNSIVDRFGFDMHHTPMVNGPKRLRRRAHEQNKMVRESAHLLAKAMVDARNVEGVYWISQSGGSSVLTQALNLLTKWNVNFEGTGHHVFFSGPTTSIVKAQNLAYDLNLKFERKAYSIGLRTHFSDTYSAPWHRRQRDPENYSRLQMSADMCKGVPQLMIGGVAIASSFGLGGLGAFIVGAGVAGFTAVAALTKAVAPSTHDKIKGKL